MYSVLIQNNSTISSFQKYKSLFLEYVNENRLGVCKWNEGGTTIDTALPGITELTNDQESWRAVIVRMKDDEAMSGFEYDIANPYEFHENTFSDELSESSVPLIRLTHILGGVPEPEIVFEEKRIGRYGAFLKDSHKRKKEGISGRVYISKSLLSSRKWSMFR